MDHFQSIPSTIKMLETLESHSIGLKKSLSDTQSSWLMPEGTILFKLRENKSVGAFSGRPLSSFSQKTPTKSEYTIRRKVKGWLSKLSSGNLSKKSSIFNRNMLVMKHPSWMF